jgi:aconitate hydratase
MGATTELIQSGARIHQAGCMGCIGMGQAPAPGTNSLRTFPRNFPGRSGAGADDQVWLCSPETAAASALTGEITDPRALADELDLKWGDLGLPEHAMVNTRMLEEPAPAEEAGEVELVKGPNISGLPEFDRFPDEFEIPILLKVGDDISTDDISPAGAAALPYRSNIPKLAQFAFVRIDEDYPSKAEEIKESGHAIVGGDNYGQGSSREHAAICPRYLGLRVVIAKSFARIHWQNLANFGILALEFTDAGDYDALEQGATLSFSGVRDALANGSEITGTVDGTEYTFRHQLSERQVSMVLAGGLIRQIAESED